MDVELQPQEANKTTKPIDIGALLVEARKNRNMSAQDIASKLNLTLSVISKIEQNQFDQNIPLAFIRGYLRSYAQRVGIDVENICVEFDRQTLEEGEPLKNIRVVSNFNPSRKEVNSSSPVFKSMTYLIVVSLLAFAGWEAWKRFSKNNSANSQITNEIQLNSHANDVSAAGFEPTEITSEDVVDESLDELPITSQIPLQNSTSSNSIVAAKKTVLAKDETVQVEADSVSNDSQALSAAGEEFEESQPLGFTGPIVQANFVFVDDCWVKVTDVNGEILAFGIKKKGKVMPIKGMAPLSVTLGAPAAVNLDFQGESYDLSRFPAGKSAQFTLE